MPALVRSTILASVAVLASSATVFAGSGFYGNLGYGDVVAGRQGPAKAGPREAQVAGGGAGAAVTPAQAIATAEGNAKGRATHLELSDGDGASDYRVKVIADGVPKTVKIDAASGQVLRTEERGFIGRLFDRDDKAETDALANVKITLAAAIDAAEKLTGGRVVEAGIDDEGKALSYEIETRKDGHKARVRVDANTGRAFLGGEKEG